MKTGVPHCKVDFDFVVAKPKSMIFTDFSPFSGKFNKTFSGLMSL